ncbi:MAG TPA: hypothetical protein P5290_01800 [Candidatus Methanomethylicus sp.]|nr:hypothetical protein [Candidatus Methanomethylicus sp.]
MKEYSLHSEIKSLYSLPGDRFEVRTGNYIVDILRGEMAIEVQTKNFSALKGKLRVLAGRNPVRLVYPLPERKWIVHVTNDGAVTMRRRSPRRGSLADVFRELVMIPEMPGEENFSLEVLLIDEEEVRCADGRGSWRRKGVSIRDRRLLRVNSRVLFRGRDDYLKLLPGCLGEPFTNRELALSAGIPLGSARQITYCLRKSGILRAVGTKGRALAFQRAPGAP